MRLQGLQATRAKIAHEMGDAGWGYTPYLPRPAAPLAKTVAVGPGPSPSKRRKVHASPDRDDVTAARESRQDHLGGARSAADARLDGRHLLFEHEAASAINSSRRRLPSHEGALRGRSISRPSSAIATDGDSRRQASREPSTKPRSCAGEQQRRVSEPQAPLPTSSSAAAVGFFDRKLADLEARFAATAAPPTPARSKHALEPSVPVTVLVPRSKSAARPHQAVASAAQYAPQCPVEQRHMDAGGMHSQESAAAAHALSHVTNESQQQLSVQQQLSQLTQLTAWLATVVGAGLLPLGSVPMPGGAAHFQAAPAARSDDIGWTSSRDGGAVDTVGTGSSATIPAGFAAISTGLRGRSPSLGVSNRPEARIGGWGMEKGDDFDTWEPEFRGDSAQRSIPDRSLSRHGDRRRSVARAEAPATRPARSRSRGRGVSPEHISGQSRARSGGEPSAAVRETESELPRSGPSSRTRGCKPTASCVPEARAGRSLARLSHRSIAAGLSATARAAGVVRDLGRLSSASAASCSSAASRASSSSASSSASHRGRSLPPSRRADRPPPASRSCSTSRQASSISPLAEIAEALPSSRARSRSVPSTSRAVNNPPSADSSCSLATLRVPMASLSATGATRDSSGSRRSSRVSLPPLSHWRNERILPRMLDDHEVVLTRPAGSDGGLMGSRRLAETAALELQRRRHSLGT